MAKKWLKDCPGNKNWLTVWGKNKDWFDSPPARLEDTENLKNGILKEDVFAPKEAKSVLSHTITLGDITQSDLHYKNMKEKVKNMSNGGMFYIPDDYFDIESNSKDIWISGIKKLKEVIENTINDDSKTFIAPVHVYYTYVNPNIGILGPSFSRHWVALIFRKIKPGKLEILLDDTAAGEDKTNGWARNANKEVICTILHDLDFIKAKKI